MRKYLTLNKIILLLITIIIVVFMWSSNLEKSQGREIVHFENAEVVNPFEDVSFSQDWFDSEHQVVTYTSNLGEYSILNFDWETAIENNPEYKFIFYYSGKRKEKLENWLKENDFKHPILFDPEKTFYNENIVDKVTSIAFIVKSNRIIQLSNPSIPSFQSDLDEVVKQ